MEPLWTVVLIARNESKTLPRLMVSLEQFQKAGGEVILMDTGSTDNTPEIARDFDCRVEEVGDRFITTINRALVRNINIKFIVEKDAPVVKLGDRLFDFAAARNYAATLSKTMMISMPDCDEEFTMLDIGAINKAIVDGAERLEYNFVFSHDEFGKEAIKFTHSKFYNRDKMKWVGMVHEVLTGQAQSLFLPETIIKLEHWQNVETNRKGYLTGLALDCYTNPSNDRNSHYFARELFYSGRLHSAIKEFDRHIAMNRWPQERGQSMMYKGDCHLKLGEQEQGLSCYFGAILLDGSRREAYLRLARHYWKLNDYQRTASFCEAALAVPWNGYYGNHMSDYKQVPHEMLYWAYWYLGDKEKSKWHYNLAFSFQPDNPKYIAERSLFYPNKEGE